MKTVRSMLGMLVACALVVPFVGCGGGSDDSGSGGSGGSSIVGTWEISTVSVPALGMNLSGDDVEGTMTFSANGTATGTGTYAGNSRSGAGTYSVNGNQLTINYDGEGYTGTYSINGNTMTLSGTETINGIPLAMTITLNRV